MYTAFYNLRGYPFQLSPDHRFFFDKGPHKKAAAYLKFGLSQGEGFVVVTGEVGAGKTTLINHVLSQIKRERVTCKVDTTQLEAENFLRMVASGFGLSQEGADKATVLRRIEAFLRETHRAGKRTLLFVDEVQNLPYSSLEELRMLSNFQENQSALLQIYLVGQPQFKKTLAGENLEQLRQRVITNYHLRPLNADETQDYIHHRLEQVGWNNDPSFTDSAMAAIFRDTGGVPRRINLLCSRLLLFGCLEERHDIDEEVVRDVIADMREEGLPSISAVDPQGAAHRGAAHDEVNGFGEEQSATLALGVLRLARRLNMVEKLARDQDDKLDQILDLMRTQRIDRVG